MADECDISWTLVGQAAQGAARRRAAGVVQACEGETAAAAAWLRTRMKQAAPQALVVGPVSRRPAPPLPLGFLALAVGTLLLARLQLGWLAPTDGRPSRSRSVAFVAPLQFTASLMGFALGEVVPATAMAILAGTWATTAIVLLTSPEGSTSAALGTLLLLSAGALVVAAAMAATLGALLPAAVIRPPPSGSR